MIEYFYHYYFEGISFIPFNIDTFQFNRIKYKVFLASEISYIPLNYQDMSEIWNRRNNTIYPFPWEMDNNHLLHKTCR